MKDIAYSFSRLGMYLFTSSSIFVKSAPYTFPFSSPSYTHGQA